MGRCVAVLFRCCEKNEIVEVVEGYENPRGGQKDVKLSYCVVTRGGGDGWGAIRQEKVQWCYKKDVEDRVRGSVFSKFSGKVSEG